MSDLTPKPISRRRVLLLGGAGAAACGAAAWISRSSAPPGLPNGSPYGSPNGSPNGSRQAAYAAGVIPTLLAFIGALFGRTLSAMDVADLSGRIAYMQRIDAALNRDCAFLAAHLDARAAAMGAEKFGACGAAQQASIVDEIMRIDEKSRIARLLSHFSRSEREYYRMRWSAVPQLAWLYRHSSAAWRARGYTHWPGTRGDWHEVLARGPAYP
jgi:hypothetical protein